MTKPELLIAELCPDGVELTTFGEVCLPISNTADTAPSRAQKIVRTNDVIFGTTRPTLKRYCFVPKEYDGQICSTGY